MEEEWSLITHLHNPAFFQPCLPGVQLKEEEEEEEEEERRRRRKREEEEEEEKEEEKGGGRGGRGGGGGGGGDHGERVSTDCSPHGHSLVNRLALP